MNGTLSSTGGFNPIIDGDFTQDYGSRALAKGRFVKVPIIVGANSDEGASFAPYGINTTQQFQAVLPSTFPLAFQEAILKAYPDDLSTNVIAALGKQRPAAEFGQQFRRASTYTGDNLFIAGRRLTAATWASHNIPTYAYRFNADQAGLPQELAISHFKEIGFVFLNILGVGWRNDIKPLEGKPQRYIDLAGFMSATWVSFVHGLDPNGWKARPKGVEKWPRYDCKDPRDYVFEANVTSHSEPDTWRSKGIDLINKHALDIYGR
jgi:carboxylesterase type B